MHPGVVVRVRGFTLVEMMVALAVLSLISLAAVSAMRSFAQSQEAVERKIVKTESMRLTLSFLKRSLSQATSIPRSGGLQSYFGGKKNELVWVAPLNHIAATGLQIMRLSVDEDSEKKPLVLQMSHYVNANSRPDWAQVEKFVLIDEAAKLEIGYKGGHQMDWSENWAYSMALPKLLRINIVRGEVYWPEMVLALNSSSKASF
ncbi:prepilin-type N-terminal cleavage/methylation domain-containing protein [Pseudoteredinibacter isoporae]|uniref:General secretion pathway protein J n=1 Tax=Pseudoteredinibacter isoporae TaxID=570281 RepID=A0A7X0JRK9_9GAMM|nr:prepilin-type N-terminal cleavage/methylation domain-containing protein [Pseudoteredinibacter isoporae]MBB6521008.1 general secretion pathway protein J [Pseudoteredinibacter isoporae]NHO86573.1 prepilin-type N-terminal cleavage/methylation domain-containing protein [Pseudoteredinibacter isoporae]NIB24975.1 prepilin-type N-terminal cleavage/methylation domain-containing protein [Pseudoteredinibacter isoporae]